LPNQPVVVRRGGIAARATNPLGMKSCWNVQNSE
jgi:hypothetical protein